MLKLLIFTAYAALCILTPVVGIVLGALISLVALVGGFYYSKEGMRDMLGIPKVTLRRKVSVVTGEVLYLSLFAYALVAAGLGVAWVLLPASVSFYLYSKVYS